MKTFYFIVCTFLAISFSSCFAAKDVKSDAKPISHSIFDTLLKKHVNSDGWVNYEGFIEDSTAFYKYLNLLSANHPNNSNWQKEERLAYWINAYNAYTIQLIIENYPVNSIKDIKDGVAFVNSVWDIPFIKIEGIEYDLNNIEHNILRQKFEEPRIHAAIVCASRSCPKLKNEAFVAERIEDQLQEVMVSFVNDSTRNMLTPEKAQLSKIFSWFRTDFTDEGTILEFVNKFAKTKVNLDAEIEYLDYGWGLNKQ